MDSYVSDLHRIIFGAIAGAVTVSSGEEIGRYGQRIVVTVKRSSGRPVMMAADVAQMSKRPVAELADHFVQNYRAFDSSS